MNINTHKTQSTFISVSGGHTQFETVNPTTYTHQHMHSQVKHFQQSIFRAAQRCLCGCKLVSVEDTWGLQRAANALTAGNLPAKTVVVGCILPLPAVSCTQQALTVTVAISSGCLYEYVWSLDITKWWAYLTLTFLCCCLLRGLSHVLLLHYRHFWPCGPFMGVLPVMNFCSLWAVEGYPPREAAMPPVGLLVSCPLRRQPCFVRGLWWVILPLRQLCPLWDTVYINAHYNFSTATCQTQLHWFQLTVLPLARLFHWFQFTALPLARLYRMNISLQWCHCYTFALISVYQPCHLSDFIYTYSRATCQTLFHWFQFTVLPLVRPYGIGFSLQPCHWSDFVSLVSVCSPATCRVWFIQVQFTTCLYPLYIAALPSDKIYFTRSKVWPGWPEFISLSPGCDLLIAIPYIWLKPDNIPYIWLKPDNIPYIWLKPDKGTHQSD